MKNALGTFAASNHQLLTFKEGDGGLFIKTTCVYPSFKQATIFVRQQDDGFIVSDQGMATSEAWLHGSDEKAIKSAIEGRAASMGLKVESGAIVATASGLDWLPSAILVVANASSMAADEAASTLARVQEARLNDEIYLRLVGNFKDSMIERSVELSGASGGTRHVDFVIARQGRSALLINGVTPHANSVAAKFTAFSDLEGQGDRIAAFSRPLATSDVALMQKVAILTPVSSIRQALH